MTNPKAGRHRTWSIIATAVLFLAWGGCKSYEPAKVDGGAKRTILLLAGQDECVSIPQEIHAHDGDELVFFSPNSDAQVTGLDGSLGGSRRDDGDDAGIRLTPVDDLHLDKGVVGAVRINRGVKGDFMLNVECGGFPDDPPKLRVW